VIEFRNGYSLAPGVERHYIPDLRGILVSRDEQEGMAMEQ